MNRPIDIELKKRCVDAALAGKTQREIYSEIFCPEHEGMSFTSFKRTLARWKKKEWPDPLTLSGGTYPGFQAYNATVQVNADGKIVQSWIRQNVDDGRWQEFLDTIRESTEPKLCYISDLPKEAAMLEIPLFDMHFPQNDHVDTLTELLPLIESRQWEAINLIVGQDLFHNNDLRGHTASGTPIEKVDMALAWNLAKDFWCNVIETCFHQCNAVKLIYSMGNHDETIAWAFVQMLKERYPKLEVNDALDQRKAIWWRECFIGFTHGYLQKTRVHDLRGQFTIEFPTLFASAKVREIHCGHLHHEAEADLYGVMIRRLGKSGIDDQWTKDNGYIGAHKRFMVFEWAPGALKAIYYL